MAKSMNQKVDEAFKGWKRKNLLGQADWLLDFRP